MTDKSHILDYKGEASRLVRFREKFNFSQRSLAKEIGSHQPFITKVEKGETSLPVHYLKYLREKYKLNLNWYFTGVGNMLLIEEDKSTLLSDLSEIKKDYNDLWAQYEELKRIVHKLVKDVYSKD
ncbi:Helix-turn-helix domain [Sphingobacterium spiritivorum]|uniref:Helix-turn-helix domain n=1 Tax=Sphingobacterium spiritivorum TaxID=258 RepID=A0A380CFS7_SPHSI|nr:helix-turn-helix transcriptional regulator [Sphingobacterium spiritivorum]SUJ18443.1 Helix-turn-helix domain [Sphingobacterium spiritivorum]